MLGNIDLIMKSTSRQLKGRDFDRVGDLVFSAQVMDCTLVTCTEILEKQENC